MEKQKMNLNRKILNKEKECEVVLDTIVPDIKPDIVTIINTNANSYIYKEEISKGRIRLDGNIDGYVLYLSETGETRSLAINMDFSEGLEDEKIIEHMRYKSDIKLQSIESKVLNERKISIIAKFNLKTEFYENTEIEFIKNISEEEKIEKLEKNYNLKKLVGVNKAKTSLKEEIALESASGIAEILKTDIKISNIENKISYNKVLAKADANIKIIYQTEEMKTEVLKASYPVMSFIDIENIAENNICETEFKMKNMLFKIHSAEFNKISMQLEFESMVEVYETEEISIIQDMYSLEKDIELSKKDIELLLDTQAKTENITINEKIGIEDINKLLDISTSINVINKTVSSNYINYELEVILDIMYEADNRNGANAKIVKLPSMLKVTSEENSTTFKISKEEFNMDKEMLNCNIEIEAKIYSENSKKITILEDIIEKESENRNEYSMIVYFVKPCDTIWNIAKKFKVTTESIINANNLENPEKINIGERLYIVK